MGVGRLPRVTKERSNVPLGTLQIALAPLYLL
jgi:hypothetical protein